MLLNSELADLLNLTILSNFPVASAIRTGPRSIFASAWIRRLVSCVSLPETIQLLSRSSRGLEGDLHFGGHGGDSEADGELGHGLIEQSREDAAVDDPFVPLVNIRRGEFRADGAPFSVDMKINAKAGGVIPAADVAFAIVSELGHYRDAHEAESKV